MKKENLIDRRLLTSFLKGFSKITGLGCAAVAPDGKFLTPPVAFTEFCRMVRSSPEGYRRCVACDLENDGLYKCHAGLLDSSCSIQLDGVCVCDIKCGQIKTEDFKETSIRRLAGELGLDAGRLFAAAEKVYSRSDDEINREVALLRDSVTLFLKMQSANLKLTAKNEQLHINNEETTRNLNKSKTVKNDFLARMNHDMHTPLTAVMGFADLGYGIATDRTVKEYFEKIKNAGEYLLRLSDDMLDIQSVGAGRIKIRPEITDCMAFVENIASIISYKAASKGLRFTYSTDFTDETRNLVFDSMRVEQILLHILNNAVTYNTPGGSIDWRMEHTIHGDKGVARHIIRDTGIGMTKVL
ncbi:MAG: PocR ligand-binding domain-containing protein [Treponema sp.]|jgi:signal transduction histidine kinase|nr:PocR ligand-binding domain-containing protein [Treponema sp.]